MKAKTLTELAKHMNRSTEAVRLWLKRDSWSLPRTPPWDVAAVRRWAKANVGPEPEAAFRARAAAADAGLLDYGQSGALTRARLTATVERAMLTRQRRLVEAGQLHDTAECQQRRLRQIHHAKNRLLELPRALSGGLVGQNAETIEQILSEQVDAILQEFATDAAKPPT